MHLQNLEQLYKRLQDVCLNQSNYTMNCYTKAAFVGGLDFGGCESDYYMMACAGFSTDGYLDVNLVTDDGSCWIQRDMGPLHYANAICCQMILRPAPSASPSDIPSTPPFKLSSSSPSNLPSHQPSRVLQEGEANEYTTTYK
eukprot:776688_1